MRLPKGFFDVVGQFLHDAGIRFDNNTVDLEALRDLEDAREVIEGNRFRRIGNDETFGFTELMVEFSSSWTWLKKDTIYYRNEGVAYGSNDAPGSNPLTFVLTRLERSRGRQELVYAKYFENDLWEIFRSSLRYDSGDRAVSEAEAAYSLGSGLDSLEMETIEFGEVLAELRGNRICWYPSAGTDTQDLLITHEDHWGTDAPQVFLHTDYDLWHRHSPDQTLLFRDKHTSVEVLEVREVVFPEAYCHRVRRDYATFPESAGRNPGGFRFLVRITSDHLGSFQRVLYELNVENIDFLKQVLLEQEIKVHTLFHCRDGSGFGGASIHFDFLYGLDDLLSIERIVSDRTVQGELEVPHVLKRELSRYINLSDRVVPKGGWERVPMAIEQHGKSVRRAVHKRRNPIGEWESNGQRRLRFD